MDLSVIIVSWNTREVLRACLELVGRQQSNATVEVWVVDNASSDGSAQMVGEAFPDVHLIENRENVGFARANNAAIAASTGRCVLLLNSDTVVHPGAFDVLVRFLDEHPEAGAAGPHTLNPDGSLQISCYPSPSVGRELWFLLHLDRLRPYGSYDMATWGTSQPARGGCRPGRVSYRAPHHPGADRCAGSCLFHVLRRDRSLLPHPPGRLANLLDAAGQDRALRRAEHPPGGGQHVYATLPQQGALLPQEPRSAGSRGLQAGAAGGSHAPSGADPAGLAGAARGRQRHLALASHYWALLHALPSL